MPTFIYRITHYRNIPFILQNGLWCPNSNTHDTNFINIGHLALVDSRGKRSVNVTPGGVLNDYIPFYFANRSPMLFLIHKGKVPDYKGTQEEVVYIVSSVEKIAEGDLKFVFSDKHAKLSYTNFYNQTSQLQILDWNIINDNNWSNTAEDNTRQDKKQAEFLIHNHMPASYILGFACMNENITNFVRGFINDNESNIPVGVRRNWYY